ncbi:MAG: zinc ABC transporter substrate-binding protein [Oscillospiraceae bacterium]|nr:zinc ABC transporter substrate-binding protein [Oscillospiraceae bacterium]
MLLSLCACSQNAPVDETTKPSADSDKLRVVCTLFPQYDFVRQIAGDKVELALLLPPGVESHSYDPTPADIKAVSGAELVIRVSENM